MSNNTLNTVEICESTCDLENVRALKELAVKQILQGRQIVESEIQAMGTYSEDAAIKKLRDTIAWETSVLDAVTRADESMCDLVGHLDRDGKLGMQLEYVRELYESRQQQRDEPPTRS